MLLTVFPLFVRLAKRYLLSSSFWSWRPFLLKPAFLSFFSRLPSSFTTSNCVCLPLVSMKDFQAHGISLVEICVDGLFIVSYPCTQTYENDGGWRVCRVHRLELYLVHRSRKASAHRCEGCRKMSRAFEECNEVVCFDNGVITRAGYRASLNTSSTYFPRLEALQERDITPSSRANFWIRRI